MITPHSPMIGLPVSGEIQDLFLEAEGAAICRDRCIESVFSTRKAIWYARRDVLCRRKAWDLVMDLYPVTLNGEWIYSSRDGMIYPQGVNNYEA